MPNIESYKHLTGFHCGTTAIRSVLRFYGHDISEQMVLGLGQGLFVSYMKGDSLSPTRLLFTRTHDLEMRAFEKLGIEVILEQTNDASKAWEWLKRTIDDGKPAMLQVDLKFLPYYNTNTSFAGHKILLVGYDEQSKTVQISDNEFDHEQTVAFDDLENARHPVNTIFDVRNNWFRYELPKELTLPEVAVPLAVREQAGILMGGPEYFGISAVDCMARDITAWKEIKDWKWCARFCYQVIEKRGTGGGGFRKPYAAFLDESEDIFPVIQDEGLAALMNENAEIWTKLALTFKQISEEEAEFGDALPFLNKISKLEKQFCNAVLTD